MKRTSNSSGNFMRRLLSSFLAFVMVFTMIPMYASAATKMQDAWNGLAGNDILIKDTVTRLAEGVTAHEVITNVNTSDQQKIDYITEIKLGDKVKLAAGYSLNDASSWSLTPTTKQAAAYEKAHPGETVVAAVNADFFNMANGAPMGALVMEGEVKHGSDGRPYFGVTKNGEPVIRTSSDLSDLEMAVGGDMIIVNNGQPSDSSGAYGELRYSRCAVGIKEDGTVVTFTTRGMRAPISCGRTYNEIAQMLAAAGCVTAMTMDGGGSATFCQRPEGSDKLVVANAPEDGAERAVSSSLLVISEAVATGVFSHAALTPNNELYTPDSEVQFTAKAVDTASMAMELPEGLKWKLEDESFGSIDAATGLFKSTGKTGIVTVQLVTAEAEVVGTTTVEIVAPDNIYFANEEISLGFLEETNFGLIVRNKGRDINIKSGDIIWTVTDEENNPTDQMGTFNGNVFTSSDGKSLRGYVKATSKWDNAVSGNIHVIVGMLPTIVYDFEDVVDAEGNVISAEDYYMGNTEKGISPELTVGVANNTATGGMAIVSIDDGEPVRFGEKALRMDYDFTNASNATNGIYIGKASGSMEMPGVPTAIGCWVYAPEGVGIEWEGQGSQAGFWLRGYLNGDSRHPYDFCLQPKEITPEMEAAGVQAGIHWEGWKYCEADITKYQAPYFISKGMTLRLMYVPGILMGTKSAGSLYFDNLQFVYGTNVDDIDAPVITSIELNSEELVEGTEFTTDTFEVRGIFQDIQNKYTSGIDNSTVRMYVDGINVVDNPNYQYVLEPNGTVNHLYDLKLADGHHTITVSVRDKFGNETSETRSFTVKTGVIAETAVTVSPVEEAATIGKTVSLEIRTTNEAVKETTTFIKIGNLFPNYKVEFAPGYQGEYSYSKLTGYITIKAQKQEAATVSEDTLIATLVVDVPATLNSSAIFTYEVKGGEFVTINGQQGTYSQPEKTLPVAAEYSINVEPVVVGGDPAKIVVTKADGNPANEVSVYLAADNSLVGVTDAEGIIVTDKFTDVGKYPVYAKDDNGLLSFIYTIGVYSPTGKDDFTPYGIKYNAVKDTTTQKSISWFSSTLDKAKQTIKYAEKTSEEWTTLDAVSQQFTFSTGANETAIVNNIRLSSLKPGTEYKIVVGHEGAWSPELYFTTQTAEKDSVKFFVIGDIQARDTSRIGIVSDKMAETDYDFSVQVGDAIDVPDNFLYWDMYADLFNVEKHGDIDMVQVLGNHEAVGEALVSKAVFDLDDSSSGSCYSTTYGDVYLAVINYAGNRRDLEKAIDWLEKDAAESDAEWKVLLTHQPPYYTNASGGNGEANDLIPPAAEKLGFDVVFSGHDHAAARTNMLTAGEIDEEDGIVYYVCGTTGDKSYGLTSTNVFDYEKIFKLASEELRDIYITAQATKEEMTINMYHISGDLMDTITLKSQCVKKGHKNIYNLEENTITCSVCNEVITDYNGEVEDEDGNVYYIFNNELKKGWVIEGTDVRYFNEETGVKEELEIADTPSTCIIDGHCIYTSESGAEKRIEYNDAGGHEYVENTDGSFVCSVCGHTRIEMKDVNVELSYTACAYTGNPRTPSTKAVTADGVVLTKPGQTDYPDYYSTYTNNVEVGTASVTLTARKYGIYVNMNEWRGNAAGSITVPYEIRPDLPTNARIAEDKDMAIMTWTPSKASEVTYVLYKSTDGENWTEFAQTKETSYVINPAEFKNCSFRIGTTKDVDGKTYESVSLTDTIYMAPYITTGNKAENGKPTLTWDSMKDVKEYQVYRSDSANGKFVKVFTTPYRTYTHTSAEIDETYYYYVVAVYNDGDASFSSKVVKNIAIPAKPHVTAAINKDGMVDIFWKDVEGADKYVISRSEKAEGSYVKLKETSEPKYTDKSVEIGNTYYYKVTPVTEKGNKGISSDIVSVKAVQVKVSPITGNRIDGKPTLSWKPLEVEVNSYEVYRSTSEDGKYVKVFTTKGNTYTHVSATAGNTYFYKVKAVLKDGNETFSNVVSNTCAIPTAEFDITTGNRDSDGKPTMKWAAVEGAASYEVYRSTSEDGKYVKVFTTKGTTYTHVSATAGNTYFYKLKAVLKDGTEAISNVVKNTCIEVGVPQKSLTVTTGNRSEDGKPTLKWNIEDGVVSYDVLRAESEDGKYAKVFTTKGNTYTHASATAGNTYWYKVRATYEDGSIVLSDVVTNTFVIPVTEEISETDKADISSQENVIEILNTENTTSEENELTDEQNNVVSEENNDESIG